MVRGIGEKFASTCIASFIESQETIDRRETRETQETDTRDIRDTKRHKKKRQGQRETGKRRD